MSLHDNSTHWMPDPDVEPMHETTECGACGVEFTADAPFMKLESPDLKGACRACAKELT